MSSYLPLSFIHSRIEDLQQALFFPLSDAPLRIPTCVVNLIKVDDLGQIWFAIPPPVKYIQTLETAFAAKLDFFRKGKDFYLKILGKAFIVHDPEEIGSIESLDETIKNKACLNEIVLIKVRVTHANYFRKAPEVPSKPSILKNIRSLLYKWLVNPPYGYDWSALKQLQPGE
jgi:hypothetical protein